MTQEKFDPNIIGEKIIKTIKTIFDPEIPVDIYELGLIYDIMINENFDVKIMMILTTPNQLLISGCLVLNCDSMQNSSKH